MADHEGRNDPASNPLDEMLCFNLYAAARAANRLYNTLLAPWGLTYPQHLVLKLLWAQESASVGDIARSLKLDSGTTTPLVRRLETRGLLRRMRSASDERVVFVTLTDEGIALEKEMADVSSDVAKATGLGFSDAQIAISTLHAMNANLTSALVSPSTERA